MENSALVTYIVNHNLVNGNGYYQHLTKKISIVEKVVLDNTDIFFKNDLSLFSPNDNDSTVSMARRYC